MHGHKAPQTTCLLAGKIKDVNSKQSQVRARPFVPPTTRNLIKR